MEAAGGGAAQMCDCCGDAAGGLPPMVPSAWCGCLPWMLFGDANGFDQGGHGLTQLIFGDKPPGWSTMSYEVML